LTKKKLIPLAVIAGLLLLFGLIKKASKPTYELTEEYELTTLTPEGFLSSDVVRLEVYVASKEDEKVVLERKDDQWVVSSKFNAPGKEEKIDEFLDKLKKLEGEFRSDSADVLEDYGLNEEKALHILAYKKIEGPPDLHLLVGKKEAWNRSFVRRADENEVYTVAVNLASEVGVYGEEMDTAPPGKDWIDKKLLDLKKDDVVKVALHTPERTIAFEKREKPKEEEDVEEGETSEEEKPSDEEDEPKEPEYEWVLAQGGAGFEFKQSGLDEVLRNLEALEAADVEDPSKAEELGLNDPAFRCEISLEGGEKVSLKADRESPSSDAYFMFEDRDDLLYKVSSWKFKGLFKAGKDLFTLPDLSLEEEGVKELQIQGDDYKVVMKRGSKEDDAEWTLASPKVDLSFESSEAEDVVKALGELQPADFCESCDQIPYGLKEPEGVLRISWEDGSSKKLSFGSMSLAVDGRYFKLEGDDRVWVLSKSDSDKLFPDLGDFFDLEVADLSEDDIENITVERTDGAYEVAKNEEGNWRLSAGDEELEAVEDKLNDLVGAFSFLDADDISLKDKDLLSNIETTIRVAPKDGDAFLIELGGSREKQVAARVNGQDVVFFFEEDTAQEMAPPLDELQVLPEEAEEAEEDAEAASTSDESGSGEVAEDSEDPSPQEE